MDLFNDWMASLETRHLAGLTFQEVSRSLRALSSVYVEDRGRLASGAALSGRGKRAAFALFYGPLHFLVVQHIGQHLSSCSTSLGDTIVDLGCGTGASGAAWATTCARPPSIRGVDRHPWAIEETRHTYHSFGLRGRARVDDVVRTVLPPRSAVLAALLVNGLDE